MSIHSILDNANCKPDWKSDFDGDVFNIYTLNPKDRNRIKPCDKIIYIDPLDEDCMIISRSYANKMVQRIREFNALIAYLGPTYVNNYVNTTVYSNTNPIYNKLNTNNNFRKLHGFSMIRNRKRIKY